MDLVFYRIARLFQRKTRYVQLRLKSSYPLLSAEGWAKRFKPSTSLFELKDDLERLAGDPDVKGLVIEIEHAQMGASLANEVGSLFDGVRKSGKHVVAHFDMPLNRDYQLGMHADDVLMTPAGRMYTFAPRFEQYFLAGLFEKIGVHAQFVHIGAFKAAANRFVEKRMPLPHRLMMEELHTDMKTWISQNVEGRRNAEAASHWSDAPIDARFARAHGLIDGIAFQSDVKGWLEEKNDVKSGDDDDGIEMLKFDSYIKSSAPPRLELRPIRRKKQIAIVDLSGIIIAPTMVLSTGGPSIDPSEVVPLLKRLRKNPRVSGVLLHVNSPGGSALSSDLIWKAVNDLRSKKPVVAYCSEVVGSGGYYIAVGADEIYCRPQSIVGSIGVIAGKFAAGKALDPVGVTVDTVADDEASTFMSVFEPLAPSALDRLGEDSRAFYRRFLNRVGQARHIPKRRLHRYARGRVYTGPSAKERGLVDGLGGLPQALKRLHELMELDPKDTTMQSYHHRKQSLGDIVRGSAFQMSGEVIEEVAQANDIYRMFQREPVLAMMMLKPPHP